MILIGNCFFGACRDARRFSYLKPLKTIIAPDGIEWRQLGIDRSERTCLTAAFTAHAPHVVTSEYTVAPALERFKFTGSHTTRFLATTARQQIGDLLPYIAHSVIADFRLIEIIALHRAFIALIAQVHIDN